MVDKAIEWLDQEAPAPFFAWVHLYEPHAPYAPPESMRARFPPTMVGAYDAEIATADLEVGRLLNHLATDGRLAHTIVVVLGDHGESLGEHDELQHAFFRVWLHRRRDSAHASPGPGGEHPQVPDQVRIVDVMPTALDLVKIDVPRRKFRGRSLLHSSAKGVLNW